MNSQQVFDDTAEKLIKFLASYSSLLEHQLVAVRETMVQTVEEVMQGVSSISDATEEKKKQAEAALESAYLRPDAETQVLVDSMQETVTNLFDSISASISQGGNGIQHGEDQPEVLLRNRLKRFLAKFSNNNSQLDQLDDDLTKAIFAMIGSLSTDDVIAQRIDHVRNSLNALQLGLNYLLLDFENRCRTSEVEAFESNLKTYTVKQYTMVSEREVYDQQFPETPPKAS